MNPEKKVLNDIVSRCIDGSPGTVSVSNSNNAVFKATLPDGTQVAIKFLQDSQIDLSAWTRLQAAIDGSIPTPRLLWVDESHELVPYDVIVTEFIEGEDLARLALRGGLTGSLDAFARMAAYLLQACRRVSAPRPGFGPFKRGRSMFADPEGYYVSTLKRFGDKLSRSGLPAPAGSWPTFLDSIARELLASARLGGVQIIPVDVNLKNFILRPQGDIAVLNVPILANAALAHGFASFILQGRILGVRETFAERLFLHAKRRFNDRSLCAFECLYLIGILAFYAAEGADRLRTVEAWGSTQSLYGLLSDAAGPLI